MANSIDAMVAQLETNTNRASNVVTTVLNAAISAAQSGADAIETTINTVEGVVNTLKTNLLRISAGFLSGGLLAPLRNLVSSITGGLSRVLSGGGGLLGRLAGGAGAALGGIGGLAQISAAILRTAIEGLAVTIAAGLRIAGTLVLGALRTAIAVATPVFVAAFQVGGALLTNGLQAAINVFLLPLRALAAVGRTIGAVVGFAQNAFSAAMNAYQLLQRAATYFGVTALQLLQSIWGVIAPILPAIGSAIVSALSVIGPALVGVAAFAVGVVGTILLNAMYIVARVLSVALIAAANAGRFVFNNLLVPAFEAIQNVFRVGQGIYNFAAPIIQNAATTAAQWLRNGFAFLQNAFEVGGQWISNAFQTLVSVLGNFASEVVRVAPAVFSSISAIVGRMWTFGTALATLIGTMGLVAAGAAAIWESTKSAMSFAKSVNQMSATNGLSSGANAGLLQRFGVFGIGAQSVQGAFGGNSGIQNMKAGAFGLPGVQDPNFLNVFSDKYGKFMASGFVGQLQATNMAKVLGLDNPEILALSRLTPGQRAGQQNFAAGINQSLGLNPTTIVQQATQAALSVNRVGYAFEQLKIKSYSLAAPLVEAVVSGAARLLGANAGRISSFMESAVRWLTVDAPVLISGALATITAGIRDAVAAIIEVGQYLVSNIPNWVTNVTTFLASAFEWIGGAVQGLSVFVSNGLQYLSDTAASWAANILQYGPIVIAAVANGLYTIGDTVGSWLEGVGGQIVDFATNADNGFRRALLGMAGALDTFINGARSAAGIFAGIAAALGQIILGPLSLIPALRSNYGLDGIDTRTTLSAFTSGRDNALGAFGDQLNTRSALEALIATNAPGIAGIGNGVSSLGGGIRGASGDAARFTVNSGIGLANAAMNGLNAVSGVAAQGVNPALNFGNGAQSFLGSMAEGVGPAGETFGNSAAAAINRGVTFAESMAPFTVNLAEAAQGLKNSVGSKAQRESDYMRIIAENSQRQTAILEEGVKNGNLMGAIDNAFGAALTKQLVQTAQRAERDAYSG